MSNGFDDQSESARLCKRDPAAWESFYERVYPMMLSYAERRMGRGEAARDAVSEALARTVKTVARMEELDATPEAWCFGILRHVVVDSRIIQSSNRWLASVELTAQRSGDRRLRDGDLREG